MSNRTAFYYTGIKELPAINDKTKCLFIEEPSLKSIYSEAIIGAKGLEEIHVRNTSIEGFPDILGEFPHLRTIVLSNNKLEKIPNSLRRCKSLKNLYVHEDNINSDFLRLVHGLPMLQSLFVKSKSDLHPEIKVIIPQLKNLYFFSKQNKPFFDLRKMKYLEEIDFFNNGLNMENVDFSNLHRLRTLLLCGNKMKEAPTSLQALNKLEYLDFRHNQITDVPKWLIGSSTIKGAYLANNALDERDIYPRHISTNKKDNFSFSEGVKTVLEGMLYRGPQPSLDSVNELNKRGIFHILNLRSDTVNYYEEVIQSKIKVINAEISPEKPSEEQVQKLLRVFQSGANTPMYAHCFTGKDRTGFACAMYRVYMQGWSKENAVKEMRDNGLHFWRENLVQRLLDLKTR